MSTFRPGLKILSEITKTQKPLQQAVCNARSLSLEGCKRRQPLHCPARSASLHGGSSNFLALETNASRASWFAASSSCAIRPTRNASQSASSNDSATPPDKTKDSKQNHNLISKEETLTATSTKYIQPNKDMEENDATTVTYCTFSRDEIKNVQDEISAPPCPLELSQSASVADEFELENIQSNPKVLKQNITRTENSQRFVGTKSGTELYDDFDYEQARSLVTPRVQVSQRVEGQDIYLSVDNAIPAKDVASTVHTAQKDIKQEHLVLVGTAAESLANVKDVASIPPKAPPPKAIKQDYLEQVGIAAKSPANVKIASIPSKAPPPKAMKQDYLEQVGIAAKSPANNFPINFKSSLKTLVQDHEVQAVNKAKSSSKNMTSAQLSLKAVKQDPEVPVQTRYSSKTLVQAVNEAKNSSNNMISAQLSLKAVKQGPEVPVQTLQNLKQQLHELSVDKAVSVSAEDNAHTAPNIYDQDHEILVRYVVPVKGSTTSIKTSPNVEKQVDIADRVYAKIVTSRVQSPPIVKKEDIEARLLSEQAETKLIATSSDSHKYDAFTQLETARLYIPPPIHDQPAAQENSEIAITTDSNSKTNVSKVSSIVRGDVSKEQQILQKKSFATSAQHLLIPKPYLPPSRGFATSASFSNRTAQSQSSSGKDCDKLKFKCDKNGASGSSNGKNGANGGANRSNNGKDGSDKRCTSVTFPHCRPRVRYTCEAPVTKRNCDHKVMPPCPSYSECIKDPTPPPFPTECSISFKTRHLQPRFPIINSKEPFTLPDPRVSLYIDPDLEDCCHPPPPPPFCAPCPSDEEDAAEVSKAKGSKDKASKADKAASELCVVEEEQDTLLVRIAKIISNFFYRKNSVVCEKKEVVKVVEKKVEAIAAESDDKHYPLDPTLDSARPLAPHCKPKKMGTETSADCMKIQLPFCNLPISTSCEPEVPTRPKCQKPLPPMPSFSECMKDPFPNPPRSECFVAERKLKILGEMQSQGIKLTVDNIVAAQAKCLKPRCFSCELAEEVECKKISHKCIPYDSKVMADDRSFTPFDATIPEIICHVDKPKVCVPRPPPPEPECNPICEEKKPVCDIRPYRMPPCKPKVVMVQKTTKDCKRPPTLEKKKECDIIEKPKSNCPPCFTGSAKKKENKSCDDLTEDCDLTPYKTPKPETKPNKK